MLTRNKETLCWELSGEKSPEYTEPPEPVLEAIGNFINADNPNWEGTATELIEKLELDIKPNALSLKLNVNAGKLYNLYFVQYSNSRSHKGRKITLRYDENHPIIGAPKVGKSFMMAQIAYHVSSGTPMWNNSVRKGTVLYLALEDDYRRLQERLYRMFGTETTPDLFFSVASKSLNEGLLDQLDTFMNEHQETSVVIIDTLQKVREAEGDTYSYARDYDIIAGLKAFADRTGICLILVHHTRKQKSDDNFDRISGTNGLLGAADGAFIMYKNKRSDGDATIEVSGRDQPDKKFMLTRNKETLCWELSGEKSPEYTEPPEPVLEAIGNFINAGNPTWEGTATELIEKLELDIKPNALSLKLNVNAGKLYNLFFVQYSNKRTHKAKLIQLRYDADHPIVISPEPTKEETEKSADGVPAVKGEIIINADTVDDIAGEDYDRAYQQMIDNALA